MKKLIMIAAVITALIPVSSWAAGTVTQTLEKIQGTNLAVLTFSWTGDASDGTVPSTDTSAAISAAIKGMGIIEVRTTPGATAPTALYDITLSNADGLDLMGGALANRSATLAEAVLPQNAAGDQFARGIDSALTLAISNNSVHSATGTVKVILSR